MCQTEDEKIEDIISEYYEKLFCSTRPSHRDLEEVLQHVQARMNTEINSDLLKPYSKEEIYAALKQMHPCKAPGPDGMHAIFYQRFWIIIGDDIACFVRNILHGNSFPDHVNKTNIALIPKVKSPTAMTELRPISLCNVLYKLVSKTVVLRLKNIFPSIVSETHSAFVPGRLMYLAD